MKVKVSLSIGYGARKDELELDDNLTDEEIAEAVQEWANNYIDIGWKKEESK